MIERGIFIALLTISVAPGCKSATPAPGAVVFSVPAPAVGDKVEGTSDIDLSFSFSWAPKSISEGQKTATHLSGKYTEDVLATSGDTVTKLRATFGRVAERTRANCTEVTTTRAIAGKTYVVDASDGRVAVSVDDGGAASAIEAREIAKLLPSLGHRDPLFASLPKVPIKSGDRADSVANALADEVMYETASDRVLAVVATYDHTAGDDAVFDITMKIAKDDGPMTLLIDLAGELRISTKTGRRTQVELKGPVTVVTRANSKTRARFHGTGLVLVKLLQRTV